MSFALHEAPENFAWINIYLGQIGYWTDCGGNVFLIAKKSTPDFSLDILCLQRRLFEIDFTSCIRHECIYSIIHSLLLKPIKNGSRTPQGRKLECSASYTFGEESSQSGALKFSGSLQKLDLS